MAAAASTSPWVELLGENLERGTTGDNDVIPTDKALAGNKQVGLYFSAHWCPPCRGFTPKLAATYKAMKAANKEFEIVFLSSDHDAAACKEYFAEMPWLQLPYSKRDLKEKLSSKYKVQGIPTLVILDGSGNLLTTKGRGFVTDDPEGKEFPWTPPTLASCLGDKLQDAEGEVNAAERLKGKNLAIYFSAHWCPPCRGFTPKLIETYKKMKARVAEGKMDDFELVFVSSDKDEAAFNHYFADMPWLALPYANRSGKSGLSDLFDVRGIPSLVTLNSAGKVINAGARGRCDADPDGLEFPWYPKAVNDVNVTTDGLNDEICIVALLAGATDASTKKTDLESVGNKYYSDAKAKDAESQYRFFYEDKNGQVSGQIRRLCGVGESESRTIILNLSDSGSYYYANSEGDVAQAISDFESKKLKKEQIKR